MSRLQALAEEIKGERFKNVLAWVWGEVSDVRRMAGRSVFSPSPSLFTIFYTGKN
jgi:hypothetical protein